MRRREESGAPPGGVEGAAEAAPRAGPEAGVAGDPPPGGAGGREGRKGPLQVGQAAETRPFLLLC